jgi:hypothetical protein
MSIKLNTSLKEYNLCTEILDKRQKKTGNMEIKRVLFAKLVLDHGIMYNRLKDMNEPIEEKK